MKKVLIAAFVVTIATLGSCKKEVFDTVPEPGNPACDTLDYNTHIKPLFDTHCNSCHQAGGTGPGDFTQLANIQANKDAIKREVVVDKTMPAPNSTGMTDAEREIMGAWIDCGANGTESTPSYASDIAPIMTSKCTACHFGSGPGPGNFNEYADVKNAVDNKDLERRVIVDQDMPQGGPPLPENERNLIKAWIDAGAPNN